MNNWTLFSNHGHVLVCLAQDNGARLRDVAAAVGITERAVQKIVRDLQDSGMISVQKRGRRNRYRIHENVHLRHALEAHCRLDELLRLVGGEERPQAEAVSGPSAGSGTVAPARPRAAAPPTQAVPAGEPEKTSKAAESTGIDRTVKKKAADANSIEKKQGRLF